MAYLTDVSDNGTMLANSAALGDFVRRPDGTYRTLKRPAGATLWNGTTLLDLNRLVGRRRQRRGG